VSDGFDTPGEAALAAWSSSSGAHIVRIESCSDATFPGRVWVFIDTVPSHPMRASCELVDGRWVVVSEISD
jgi:hypothetical protein